MLRHQILCGTGNRHVCRARHPARLTKHGRFEGSLLTAERKAGDGVAESVHTWSASCVRLAAVLPPVACGAQPETIATRSAAWYAGSSRLQEYGSGSSVGCKSLVRSVRIERPNKQAGTQLLSG